MIESKDLIAIIGEYSKKNINEISPQTKIKDFDFDSLTTLEVIYELEQKLNLAIDETSIPSETFSEYSIAELAIFLESLKKCVG